MALARKIAPKYWSNSSGDEGGRGDGIKKLFHNDCEKSAPAPNTNCTTAEIPSTALVQVKSATVLEPMLEVFILFSWCLIFSVGEHYPRIMTLTPEGVHLPARKVLILCSLCLTLPPACCIIVCVSENAISRNGR